MPDERTVSCPACSAERTTRAGAGTRLTCPECKKPFRAPKAAAQTPVAPPAEVPAGDDTGRSGGVKVQRATKTVVRQTARPRSSSAATAPAAPTPEPAPASPPAPVPDPPAPPAPPAPTRAQVLGRRGGRAVYARRIKARAEHR